MASEAFAGEVLLHLRRLAGISQADLAERSGVSARTIRGLESGAVRRPHGSTLLALAAGLRLPPDAIERFLDVWKINPPQASDLRSIMAISDGAYESMRRAVAAGEIRDAVGETRILSLARRVTIGRDRRLRWVEEQRVIEALIDGVSGEALQMGAQTDIRLLRMDRMTGCELAARYDDVGVGVASFDLTFGARLSRGELKAFSLRWGFGDHPPEDHSLLPAWVEMGGCVRHHFGYARPLPHLMIQIAFDGERPRLARKVVEVQGRTSSEQVEPDAFGTIHLFGQDLAPGTYRIEWDWD